MSKRKDNVFASTLLPGVKSNSFDLSHDVKMSLQMGKLVPTCCIEVLPGDRFNVNHVNMMRLMPMIAPVMHRMKVTTDYFFVPNRILWDGWEDFITGTGDDLPHPYLQLNDELPPGALITYLGIPPGDYTNETITASALPYAAYFKIYDDWYRDQNQISEKFQPLISGFNDFADELLEGPLKRAWEHDYFTSALPTSQQGTDVELPLTFQDNIPVDFTPGANAGDGTWQVKDPVTGAVITTAGNIANAAGPSPLAAGLHLSGSPIALDPNGTLTVDIQSDAATINDLRRAWTLQSFLERSIRGGLRYVEQLKSHFGVTSSDARLQRAEFLGRSVQNMTISEVLSTAQSNNDAATAQVPVGQMAGHGISAGGGNGVSFQAEEHGWFIGIVSVLPDTAYQDGLPRHFSRTDRLDYAFPEFAGLGEQAILGKELMCHGLPNNSGKDAVWGYVPRYSEYRYHPSRVAGQFATTLDFWHMGRKFVPGEIPGLNVQFIEADPTKRIFAVTDENEDEIAAHVMLSVKVNRKLPRYGVPAMIG